MTAKRVRPPQHHGKPGIRLSDETKAEILRLCRDGVSRNDIAKRVGCSAASVSGVVKRAREETGDAALTFDRSKVAAATEARKVDLAARRAALAQGLLDDVEKLRAELFAPTTIYSFGGKDNSYNERQVDKPPFADQLKIVQAAGAAIDRHLKLDAHDNDEQGLTAVDAFLKGMLG
jgi:transposase-like protein